MRRAAWIALLCCAVTALAVYGHRRSVRRAVAAEREQVLLESLSDRARLAALEPRHAALLRELEQTQSQVDATRTRLTESEAAGDPLRRTVERLSGERIQQGVRLDEQAARIAALERDLGASQRRAGDFEAEVARLRQANGERDDTITELRRQVATVEAQAQSRLADLEATRAKARTDADLARQHVRTLEEASARAASEAERLRAELRTRTDEIEALRQQIHPATNAAAR